MIPVPAAIEIGGAAALALYATCQALLVAYSAHRWQMLGPADGEARAPRAPWWEGDAAAPRVLVQLPVHDEPAVVGRLVAAVAALDWPRERLEVQLLDDSGDAAAAIGARAVDRARAAGVRVTHLRRRHRAGFKAGALAAGLAASDAGFVVVFDADFVPGRDFLRRMLPHFADPRVGLVQARWGHLNRDASLLTRAQAAMLDAHQLVEHAWRQRTGRFLNFNGTAGVWRRACIDSAGGWAHDTLTEDLDLSYRAQLAGWRFVFEPGVVVPAELPEDMTAFRSQQHRWAKGALQTARKLLPRLWAAPLPPGVKLEASLHLTANVTYPLLLVLAATLVPVLAFRAPSALSGPALALHTVVFVCGTLPVALFLARGQWRAGRHGARALLDVALAMVLCGGMALHVARAVVEGLWGATGEFVRTPKTGRPAARARPRPGRFAGPRAAETLLACGCVALGAAQLAAGRATGVPFLLAMAAGFLWVGLATRRPAAGG